MKFQFQDFMNYFFDKKLGLFYMIKENNLDMQVNTLYDRNKPIKSIYFRDFNRIAMCNSGISDKRRRKRCRNFNNKSRCFIYNLHAYCRFYNKYNVLLVTIP